MRPRRLGALLGGPSTSPLGVGLTRAIRVAVSIVAWVPILFGIGYLSNGIITGYMLTIGGVAPGEPMNWDDLAPPLHVAILEIGAGVGLITLGAIVRMYVSRKGRAAS
jgi:hypothetical protein